MSAAKARTRVVAPASGPITTVEQIDADNARFWKTSPEKRASRDGGARGDSCQGS